MKTMKNLIETLLIVSSLAALTACGGGGGGDSSGGAVKFEVNLASVDIRRISNGDPIDVEVSGISSGELTYEE